MNLANKFTLYRLFGTILFITLLLSGLPYTKTISLIIFILACITDWLDGKIARKLNIESDFGRLMDPLVDKILVTSAFIAFIEIPQISLPSFIVIIIIGREFSITGLRLLAANKGTVIPADLLGKHKTIIQIIAIIAILVYLSLIELDKLIASFTFDDTFRNLIHSFIVIIILITVIITVISGISYLKKSWTLLKGET